jgi:hypothetical protein
VVCEWYRLRRPGQHYVYVTFDPVPEDVPSALEVLAHYPELAGRVSLRCGPNEDLLRDTATMHVGLDVTTPIDAIPAHDDPTYLDEEEVFWIRPSVVPQGHVPSTGVRR